MELSMKVVFPIDYCSFVCNDFSGTFGLSTPNSTVHQKKNEFSMFYLGLNYAGLDIIAKKNELVKVNK